MHIKKIHKKLKIILETVKTLLYNKQAREIRGQSYACAQIDISISISRQGIRR